MSSRKATRMKSNARTGPLWRCADCDLAAFDSRKSARDYARAKYPGNHFSAFSCPTHPGYFHFGVLPKEVARGERTFNRNPRKAPE